MRNVALLLIAALALLGGAFLWGYSRGRATIPPPEIVRDTVTFRDTIEVDAPRIVTSYIVDTLTMEVITVQHDTILATLPREEVTYQDSTYTAIVSGIYPRLDSLAIYPRREVVTIHTTERVTVPRRWGIGLQAGYGGVLAEGKIATGPYIGVGVTYNIFGW